MNNEILAETTDDSSTNADGKQVSPTCPKPNVSSSIFSLGDRIVWDSHFGYEIGYFLGEGVVFNSYLVDVKTGKIQERCSYSKEEIHKYSNELIDTLSQKYGYEKRFNDSWQTEDDWDADWEDDFYDDDDEEDELQDLGENCTCGAYIIGKDGSWKHVSDCCC